MSPFAVIIGVAALSPSAKAASAKEFNHIVVIYE
jgi:hypothetical protein